MGLAPSGMHVAAIEDVDSQWAKLGNVYFPFLRPQTMLEMKLDAPVPFLSSYVVDRLVAESTFNNP